MNAFEYKAARALYPHGVTGWDMDYLYEPLPVPADHPELALFPAISEQDKQQKAEAFQEVLPARMLNEYVYCPRLFYYEFVEGLFLHSADTERGNAIHKKVDKGKGDLPSPEPDKELAKPSAQAEDTAPQTDVIHSRSATLGSERLKVTAKMDLVEVTYTTYHADSLPITNSPIVEPKPSPAVTGRKKSRSKAAEPDLFAEVSTAAQSGVESTINVPPQEVTTRQLQCVTPVDYKAGSPKTGDNGLEVWDADKMQLGLQILILRDNGYQCNEGVIYYRETKQRVTLPMTPELQTWVENNIHAARLTAVSGKIPPPLITSPKCIRCSLAPICLPDETHFMQQEATVAEAASADLTIPPFRNRWLTSRNTASGLAIPRRLIVPKDDTRALYLTTQGTHVSIRSDVLIVKEDKSTLGEFRLKDVSHVALFGNIQITTQSVQTLCEAEKPLAYFSTGGWFYGLTRGHGLKNVFTRIEQFSTARLPHRCLALAQSFVHGKIRNHRTQLMRNHISLSEGVALKLRRAAVDALEARSLEQLLGIEGAAAALYFQNFSGMIKVSAADDDDLPGLESDTPLPKPEVEFTFDFTKRTRRPPADPVNALLSLAYSILAKDCTLALLAVGFDPYVGFYHQPRHGRPALALDLMEEFRPLIAESAVLTALNNRMLNTGHFVKAGDAVNLTPQGRKAFFMAYEQRINSLITHPIFDYKVSYRRILELQARMLLRYLNGEIPEYIPMTTR